MDKLHKTQSESQVEIRSDIAAEADPLVVRYLEHVRVERRLAARTVTLYELDLIKLAEYAKTASINLVNVQTSHIRRWCRCIQVAEAGAALR
jgi:site-specific recombinase XerD